MLVNLWQFSSIQAIIKKKNVKQKYKIMQILFPKQQSRLEMKLYLAVAVLLLALASVAGRLLST